MLPSAPGSASRRFFNLAIRTVHDIHLPEAIDHAICESLNEYIIMLNRSTLQVTLLNPFNRSQKTDIPPLRPFRKIFNLGGRMSIDLISHSLHSYAWNIILPGMEEIMVVFTIIALSCTSFVYWRTCNTEWTEVDSRLARIQSMAYHRGKFYVVGQDRTSPVVGERSITVIDTRNGDGGSSVRFPSTLLHCCLIESGQDLLLVAYQLDVTSFVFFKLCDVDQEVPRWAKLTAGVADGCQLFFMPQWPSSVVVTGVNGAEGDCIYFPYEELGVV